MNNYTTVPQTYNGYVGEDGVVVLEVEEGEPCRWFVLCDQYADVYVPHPILGNVPTCNLCVDRIAACGG